MKKNLVTNLHSNIMVFFSFHLLTKILQQKSNNKTKNFLISSGNCYRTKIDKTSSKSIESPTSLSDILAPSSSSQQPQKSLPHSIRLVDIPWSSEHQSALRLSIDDSQNGTMPTIANKHNGIRISQ